MSADDRGLDVFLNDETSTGPVHESVFRAVDQRNMLERLDAMEDEELSDGYFDSEFTSAQRASTSSLALGIRTLIGHGEGTGERVSAGDGVTTSVPGVPDSARAHRAFVLEGPANLSA